MEQYVRLIGEQAHSDDLCCLQITPDTELGPLYTLCPVVSMTTLKVEATMLPDFPDEETKAEGKPEADGLTLHSQDFDWVS